MELINRYQPTFSERYPVPFVVALLDMLIVIVASLLAHDYRFATFDMAGRYNTTTLLIAAVVVLCITFGGGYGSQRGVSIWRQLGILLACWCLAAGILLSLSFFLKVSGNYSRIWFSSTLILGAVFSLSFRVIVYLVLRQLRSSGMNLKSVLLVDTGGETARRLNRTRKLNEFGFKVATSFNYRADESWLAELVEQVERHGAHEVWLCLPLSEGGGIQAVMYALRHHTVAVRFIPEWGDIRLLNHRVSYIAGLYSLDLSCSPIDGPAQIVKRLEDLVVGGLISLMILPVCAVIGIVVKLSSPGPMLFKQYRTGINGVRFKVYKFRSMVVHDDKDVTQATRNDMRVTKVGAFLRRTSLDELPQFFNVLQGRMSLVGPRPHALVHNEYYKDLVESYMQRHKVKPGITGWAQVSGFRGETDTLEKMQKRVEHDLWYIDNWSLWLDLKIIASTVFKGFINKNAF
ncbi:undecaprenyl-phosphate glucose phosphotransferase [Pseudomonas sp. BIGb0427]|uniref:undecaprenyl-phosphate glucose phosphotransferase n=1 Tax=unclassified Pseudomonas TaxID=196821 RepID=UPI0005EAF9D0|nr:MULTISPECIES: undecaprenyl-phosphate glucose phosphotransferase [unclassified Pseudomonas]KJK19529.1 UDP-phosphate galactose phosphotransferase [Pseudomonas sp. 2(2015)]QPG63121.1 undecaprenyl-phosphate glucose phosphotransferase [Pseudomonas sp. BIGb0427]QVM98107.1 undecaprenyl-phosphate glucose phosphotransferase [Pseudomonas sp. SORT22]UVL55009.1 undecaprenyl-phosphate glucose phosphotransferase [Pseudomonas sp. B21-035]UVM54574.1 undecaprenyl-phosphate glucose phosphotransferase [Pseudo